MTLYIDGLFYRASGIGRYYTCLTHNLAFSNIKIYTCIPIWLRDEFESDFSDVSDFVIPIYVNYDKFSIKAFFDQSFILKKLERDVDLFFYPHVNLPFYIPHNTIVTIHDLTPLSKFWDRNNIKLLIYFFYLYRAVHYSKKIISVSHVVSNEIIHRFNSAKDKISIIYEFVDNKFMNFEPKAKSIIDGNYILYVGNRKKHKNLENLIRAFNIVKNQLDIKLVLAGSQSSHHFEECIYSLISSLKLEDYILHIFHPSDSDIINLYFYAKLFVFPSFLEGFGLPRLRPFLLDPCCSI